LVTTYKTQVQNACLSAAVLEFLNVPTDGMKDFFWPCRMDGCHNDDSVFQFLTGLKSKYPGRKIRVLFGAGMEKHLGEMLQHVVSYADNVLMVQSRHFKSLGESDLVESVPMERRSCLVKEGQPTPMARQPDGTVALRLRWAMDNEW
jgi:folylpolyglutamate synthase/dihydropteroate synthase